MFNSRIAAICLSLALLVAARAEEPKWDNADFANGLNSGAMFATQSGIIHDDLLLVAVLKCEGAERVKGMILNNLYSSLLTLSGQIEDAKKITDEHQLKFIAQMEAVKRDEIVKALSDIDTRLAAGIAEKTLTADQISEMRASCETITRYISELASPISPPAR